MVRLFKKQLKSKSGEELNLTFDRKLQWMMLEVDIFLKTIYQHTVYAILDSDELLNHKK
jgi:hypothetical protein